jgi:hypothetical protein
VKEKIVGQFWSDWFAYATYFGRKSQKETDAIATNQRNSGIELRKPQQNKAVHSATKSVAAALAG